MTRLRLTWLGNAGQGAARLGRASQGIHLFASETRREGFFKVNAGPVNVRLVAT